MKGNWSVRPDSSGLPESLSKAPCESGVRRRLGPGGSAEGIRLPCRFLTLPPPQPPAGCSIPLVP